MWRVCCIAAVWSISLSAAVSGEEKLLLERIREKMRIVLATQPNYTCVQTVDRYLKAPRAKRFRPIDRLRLEVSLVDGKELYSWPGAVKFEEKSIEEIVGRGHAIGSGNFAMHARAVFFGEPAFTFAGQTSLNGRRAVGFHFQVSRSRSGYEVRSGTAKHVIGYEGLLWADPETHDLIELRLRGMELPPDLQISEVSDTMRYARIQIAESEFLLPQSSELLLTTDTGEESRNVTRFSGCRQYAGESKIVYEDPEVAGGAKGAAPLTPLPPNTRVDTALEGVLDLEQAAIGDPVTTRLVNSLKLPDRTLPKGTAIIGRITRMRRPGAAREPYVLGLRMERLESGGSSVEFHAELEDTVAADRFYYPVRPEALNLQQRRQPGEALLGVRNSVWRLPAGLRLIWRTF